MGIDGPCGPCTEIHYSHKDGIESAKSVNTDDSVVELWNLVFMEHCLNSNGALSNLNHKHIDTGMGLERLTAVLNGSKSNYDTDLFDPLFEIIQKESGVQAYSGGFTRYVEIEQIIHY